MWSHLKDNGIKLPKITAKEIDKKVEVVLRAMEKKGIKLDVVFLNKMAKDIEKRLEKIEKQIWELAEEEFNISSPIQLAEILFKKLRLDTSDVRKTKSGFSTAASELRKIESKHKIIKPILEYRELSKLLSTYLKPLPLLVDERSRLHTTYGQDTTTGRLTSCDPNLQNIPIKGQWGGEIRKAFVAEEGNLLVSADYSQIELRVVACLSGDTAIMEAFRSGIDIHTRTASEIFNVGLKKVTDEQRRIAKTVNFGVLYGMSPYGLSQALGIDQEQAAQYIRKYFEVHSGIKNYCNRMIEHASEKGYVETLFGFKRHLSNINSPYHNIAEAEERMAVNTPVQGTAAEILKLAMIELETKFQEITNNKAQTSKNQKHNKADNYPQLLLTVHDELVVECDKKEVKKVAKTVKDVMEKVISLCVPIEAEVKAGKNWGEMSKIS